VVARTQPDARTGTVSSGGPAGRSMIHARSPGRADQPELVSRGGGQRLQGRGGEHQLVMEWDITIVTGSRRPQRAGHLVAFPRGQHRATCWLVAWARELVPHAAVDDPEHHPAATARTAATAPAAMTSRNPQAGAGSRQVRRRGPPALSGRPLPGRRCGRITAP